MSKPYCIGSPRGTTPPESASVGKSKFSKKWKAWYFTAHDQWDVSGLRKEDADEEFTAHNTFSVLEDLSGEDAILIAAVHDLRDYAEAEEKARQIWELGEACHREERPISEYFDALERDFPTIAQKCPILSPAEILEWFGEEKDPLEARWEIHFLSQGEECAGNMIGEYLIALRSAALAKARGEEAGKQPCNKMLTDDLPRIPIE